jgi:hypothetical protein
MTDYKPISALWKTRGKVGFHGAFTSTVLARTVEVKGDRFAGATTQRLP